jgi:Fe-S cluster biogenesis protein NfuA
MAAPRNLRAAGDRIEQLLEELRESVEPRSFERCQEMLGLVTDLYGAGLERILEIVSSQSPGCVESLASDGLVGSLLLVHELHPRSLSERVEAALEKVGPILASHGGDVELVEVDKSVGAVRLRLRGSCSGCPSSEVTLQSAVERAILDAAPEVVTIEVDQPEVDQPPNDVPLLMGTKPTYQECPPEVSAP